jgi:hypothetical protein
MKKRTPSVNIASLRKVKLAPDDVLVLKIDSPLVDPQGVSDYINTSLRKAFPRNKAIVMYHGAELSVVSPAKPKDTTP